jgi:hypothetical protein
MKSVSSLLQRVKEKRELDLSALSSTSQDSSSLASDNHKPMKPRSKEAHAPPKRKQ